MSGEAKLVSKIAISGLILSLAFSFFGGGYNILEFLTKNGRFDDFYNSLMFHDRLYNAEMSYIISPIVYWLFSLLSLVTANVAFIVYNLVFAFMFIALIGYHFKRQTGVILAVILFYYPLWFTVSRGNIDLYLALFLYGFLLFYKSKYRTVSVLSLSVAVAIKPPMCMLFLILLSEKDFKNLILASVTAALLFVIPIAIMPKGFKIEFSNFLAMYSNYQKGYSIGDGGLLHGHSLYGGIKVILYLIKQAGWLNLDIETIRRFLFVGFKTISIPIFLFSVYLIGFKKNVLWIKFFIVLCMNSLIFNVEADYRLLYYVVGFLFFITNSDDIYRKKNFAILLGLLFVPKAFICFRFPEFGSEAIIGSLINPLIISAIFFLIAKQSFSLAKT